MYSKSERLLIKRFLFSKKTDGYISVFSWFSIIGIALGVAAIIIVMSVMNGFRSTLTEKLLGVNSHLNLLSSNSEITKNQIDTIKDNLDHDLYNIVLESIETKGLLIKDNISQGILIRGYEDIKSDHYVYNKLISGNLFDDSFNEIIIGDYLSNSIGANLGDKIKLAIPKSDKSILGNIPRFKTLKIIGIFDFGMYEYDANLVFISAELSRKLLLMKENSYNKVEFFLKDPSEVDFLKKKLTAIIDSKNLNLFPYSWKDRNLALINALNVEKNVMFLILTLIIFVASMNIVSGLIIFVKEKNKDIGILKTLGLSNLSIIKIFFSIGILIGLIGASLGTLIGIVFTLNIQYIQLFLENILNTKLFVEEVYYLSSLPSELRLHEVFIVFLTSLLISIISTIFPALRSAKIDPITTIRSE